MSEFQEINFNYPLKTEEVTISGKQPLKLRLQCLESLDRAIDLFFEYLQAHGQESLLETHCPYFGVIWPSALALAEVVNELPETDVRDKRILEIGCGLALPSMVAKLRGADILATDNHPEVPRFLERNLALNSIHGLKYQAVDWEQGDAPPVQAHHYDWIIGSDILYERKHTQLVPQVIHRHLSRRGKVIVVDPARPYLQSFIDEMKALGFKADTSIRKTSAGPEVFILRFSR